MTLPSGQPFDPRASRQRPLTVFLQTAVVVVFLLAVVGLALPEDAGHDVSVVMVLALIAVPAIRVGWLVLRWSRRGDVRFALAGAMLLAVMASGIVLSR